MDAFSLTSSEQPSEDQQSSEFRHTPDQTSSSLNDARENFGSSSKPGSTAGEDNVTVQALAEITLEQQLQRDEELHRKSLQTRVTQTRLATNYHTYAHK